MAVVGIYGPDPYCATGYGKHGKEIAKRLKADGHTVIYLGNQHLSSPIDFDGITVTPFIKEPFLDDVLEYWIEQFHIEVIVCLWNFWAVKILPALKKKLGVKYIIWSPIEGEVNMESLNEEQHDILLNADAIIGVSDWSRQQFSNAGYDAHSIHCGVSGDFKMLAREQTRKDMGVSNDIFVVGFVGKNYTERKMHPIALMAFKRFLDRLKPEERAKCQLYMHTEKIYTSRTYDLPRLIRCFGLEKNVMLPSKQLSMDPIDDVQMNKIYNLMDVIMFPSMGEGQNMPMMEAMRCGVPVIAHDAHAHRELMENTMAMRIPSVSSHFPLISGIIEEMRIPDVDKFADCLYQFYLNFYDKEQDKEWPHISTSEMEKAKPWTWEATYQQFKPILEEVLKK